MKSFLLHRGILLLGVTGAFAAYPRVNLAPQSEVGPDWPARPAGIEWAGVPSIAVDGADQVWVLFMQATSSVNAFRSS